MAYQASTMLEDEDDKRQGQVIIGGAMPSAGNGMPGGAPSTTSQAGGQQLSKGSAYASQGQATGGAGASGSPVAKPGTSSGAWTNLNKYLEANRGQGARMAGTVAQSIDSKVGAFKDDATKVETGIGQQVDAGSFKGADVSGQVKADPTKVSKDQFKAQWDAFYKGPKDAQQADGAGLARVGGQKTAIDQDLKDTGTTGGQMRLLGDTYASPTYSRGEKTFDSFLVGTDGGDELAGVRGRNTGFADGWQGIHDRIGTKVGEATKATDAARESVRGAWNEANTGIRGRIDKAKGEVDALNAGNDALYAERYRLATSADPNERLAAGRELGLTDAEAQAYLSRGGDLTRLFGNARNQSLADVVSDNDRATLAALQDLAGDKDLAAGYDFGEKGGTSQAFTSRDDLIGAIRGMANLDAGLQGRLAKASEARDLEYELAKGGRSLSTYTNLGLTEDDIYYLTGGDKREMNNLTGAEKLLSPGTDLSKTGFDGMLAGAGDTGRFLRSGADFSYLQGLVGKGKGLGLGDVATDADRQQWGALMATLGLGGADSLADANDEGRGYTIDINKLRSEAAKRRDAVNQRREALRVRASQHKAGTKPPSSKANTQSAKEYVKDVHEQFNPVAVAKNAASDIKKGPIGLLSDERKKTDKSTTSFSEIMKYLERNKKGAC